MRTGQRLLGAGLLMLGAAVAVVAALGPLVLDVLRYRVSPTSLNQVVGGDAAALAVVAPITVAVGVLAIRDHPAAPMLALAPSIFVVYTYTRLILGNEYLRLPGNVERFFPLLLLVFILAAVIAVRAWTSIPATRLPPTSAGVDRMAGVLLLVIAVFVVLGLHLPNYLDAMSDRPETVQYLSSPSAFGASVAGMAITMVARHDSDASVVTAAGSILMATALAAMTGYVYRPLFRRARVDLRPTLVQLEESTA
jgi:hypothetical protein